jgi:hypothetical protein
MSGFRTVPFCGCAIYKTGAFLPFTVECCNVVLCPFVLFLLMFVGGTVRLLSFDVQTVSYCSDDNDLYCSDLKS